MEARRGAGLASTIGGVSSMGLADSLLRLQDNGPEGTRGGAEEGLIMVGCMFELCSMGEGGLESSPGGGFVSTALGVLPCTPLDFLF
jgi:hypothetical protein